MGRIHAEVAHRLADGQRGQGTVEYVGLVMLMAAVLGVVVTSGKSVTGVGEIPKTIVAELKEALDDVSPGGK